MTATRPAFGPVGDKRHRPLSQTGLNRYRIPANPRQRRTDPQTGHKVKRRALEHRAERLAAGDAPKRLHPTKGFRKLSARQSEAERLVGMLRRGVHYATTALAARFKALW